MTTLGPWRRSAELEITETEEGVVVYQPSRGRVHALNASAAVILELCDGTRNAVSVAVEIAELFGLAELPVALTEECIDGMARDGLVSQVAATSAAHQRGPKEYGLQEQFDADPAPR